MAPGSGRKQPTSRRVPPAPRPALGAHPSPAGPSSPGADELLQACLDLTRQCLGKADVSAVARAIIQVALELAGADQASLGLVDKREVITIASLTRATDPAGTRFPLGFGIAGWVAATGQPLDVPDLRDEPRYVAIPYPEPRALVAVPLRAGFDTIGVLSLTGWQADAFPSGLAARLASFGEQAALYLDHAARQQTIERRLRYLEAQTHAAVAEVSHDLKAPLHSMLGYLDVVLAEDAGTIPASQKERLESARDQGHLLRSALAGLITVTSEADSPERTRKLIQPRELVDAAIALVRGEALARGIAIKVRQARSIPLVRVDPSRVRAVLANLLQNALRVAPPGTAVRVSLSTEPGRVTWRVEDEGPGLPNETGTIFDRYQTSGEPENAAPSGRVGLGLWLARREVEAHGGQIEGANRATGGATFILRLPVAESASGRGQA